MADEISEIVLITAADAAHIEHEGAGARALLADVMAFAIVDDATYATAGELLRLARTAKAALQRQKTAAVAPATKLFADAIGAFAAVEDAAREKMNAHATRIEESRRAAAAKAFDAARERFVVNNKEILAALAIVAPPTAEGVRTERVRCFEIVDADAVPRELCSPDEKKIRAAIASGLASFPGVRVFEEERVVVR